MGRMSHLLIILIAMSRSLRGLGTITVISTRHTTRQNATTMAGIVDLQTKVCSQTMGSIILNVMYQCRGGLGTIIVILMHTTHQNAIMMEEIVLMMTITFIIIIITIGSLTDFPNCSVPLSCWIGDNYCDDYSPYNTEECGFDGGDCIPEAINISDGLDYSQCFVPIPSWVGDGICDPEPYYTPECNYDGGDCGYPGCNVTFDFYLGDNICDGPEYNTEVCFYDGGDCLAGFPLDGFNYTECEGISAFIADGFRNLFWNTSECNYDGGDCFDFVHNASEFPEDGFDYSFCITGRPDWIGDGICDDFGAYITPECNFDGGDCGGGAGCIVDFPLWLGDEFCDNIPPYNTPECNNDGGDCE